jgi:16S rRNA (cytosine1402-N4)-methyltransferase
VIQSNFRDVTSVVKNSKFQELYYQKGGVDGVLFDLGVSSHQIDNVERGFAFRFESSPLDMRMDQELIQTNHITAKDLINNLDTEDLARLLSTYGEDSRSHRIANELVACRPFESAGGVQRALRRIIPEQQLTKSLARIFQALRIVVNDELGALSTALSSLHEIVRPGGRLVVLSYHSLEDRLVKQLLQKPRKTRLSPLVPQSPSPPPAAEGVSDPPSLASGAKWSFTHTISPNAAPHWVAVEAGVITPSREEVKRNSRSRSAKMRVGERVGEGV